jgi:hypothetical protein
MLKMHIDSFTNVTVVDLKKSNRNENGVLYALKYHPRVSTWDMSENAWLRNIIASLQKKELIVPVAEPYPWHKWKLTIAGEKAITV